MAGDDPPIGSQKCTLPATSIGIGLIHWTVRRLRALVGVNLGQKADNVWRPHCPRFLRYAVMNALMDATTLWPVIRHALVYGGVLSAVLCVLLLGVLWMNPEILLNDYPPDIRKKHGPMSERSKQQKLPVTIVIGGVALGIVIASFSSVKASGGGRIPFLTAFVHLFVMFSVFNAADLILLDWPLVAIRPRFMVLPGTEDSAGYKDYLFHFRGFLIGTVLIFVISALTAAVVAALF